MRRLCFEIARSLVIIVNLIVTVLAFLLIYVSFNTFEHDYNQFNDGDSRLVHTYVVVACIGLGLLIGLLSLLGLFGAIRKSKSLLGTYAAIVFFMVSLLFVLVIFTLSIPTSTSSSSYKEVDKSFVNSTLIVYNYVDSSDWKSRIIDNIQKSFSCCGVNSPNDWTEYSLQKIPKSCCSEPVEQSLPVFKYCNESDHKVGCWKALTDHFHASLGTVRTMLYTLIGFGLICIAAACFMIRTLRRSLDVV